MPAGARAKARAERERLAALAAAERAARTAKEARRRAHRARLLRWLPSDRGKQTGALAVRRRRQTRMLVVALVLVNALVWFLVPGWAGRALALVVSVLAAPMLYTLLFRKA